MELIVVLFWVVVFVIGFMLTISPLVIWRYCSKIHDELRETNRLLHSQTTLLSDTLREVAALRVKVAQNQQ